MPCYCCVSSEPRRRCHEHHRHPTPALPCLPHSCGGSSDFFIRLTVISLLCMRLLKHRQGSGAFGRGSCGRGRPNPVPENRERVSSGRCCPCATGEAVLSFVVLNGVGRGVAATVMATTLDDLEREAGVCKMTVSLALRGKGRMAVAARERIRRLAVERGCRPNAVRHDDRRERTRSGDAYRARRSNSGRRGSETPRSACCGSVSPSRWPTFR